MSDSVRSWMDGLLESSGTLHCSLDCSAALQYCIASDTTHQPSGTASCSHVSVLVPTERLALCHCLWNWRRSGPLYDCNTWSTSNKTLEKPAIVMEWWRCSIPGVSGWPRHHGTSGQGHHRTGGTDVQLDGANEIWHGIERAAESQMHETETGVRLCVLGKQLDGMFKVGLGIVVLLE